MRQITFGIDANPDTDQSGSPDFGVRELRFLRENFTFVTAFGTRCTYDYLLRVFRILFQIKDLDYHS